MPSFMESEIKLELPDSDIRYIPGFIETIRASGYFEQLKKETPWRQDDIRVFGKVYPQPRLTALYADNNKPYNYSNLTMHPIPFTPLLTDIKVKVEAMCGTRFTTCLLNLYRDGRDSNGWHADNEKELGENPVIASVSLGEARYFHLKHRENKNLKHKLELGHGSLLLMQGPTQHHWLHQIPKTNRPIGERINLTFRVIQ
ncbi:MAG: alpha-ketoglutarate-dependent dioxygenase AlkB [Flavobacteriaceae bacterium]|nr:alpha-ketoglutarate-dependent dioxygenase AlkB [Eudoraea sp.]NNJ37812.1 alpha-ketoglutarate-dependent dioxygenase AlkB [Flavobacteriaceae bacterium]